MQSSASAPRLGVCLNYLSSTALSVEALPAVHTFLSGFLTRDEGQTPWFSGTVYVMIPAGSSWTARLISGLKDLPLDAELRFLESSASDFKGVLESLASRQPSGGETGIFHFWGDSAFLNLGVNREILSLHLKYLSDYVFAEGYPGGIAGEILSDDILPAVAAGGDLLPVSRDGIFESVRPNINSFEVETAVSPADLRMLRLELYHDYQRNARICRSLEGSLDAATEPAELCDLIGKNLEPYRSLPAFFALQIAAACPQSCSYCPYPIMNPGHLSDSRYLATDKFRHMLDKICSFVEDPVVSLSALGEPAMHPDLPAILKEAAERKGVRYLIETSGIGWSEEARAALAAFAPGSLDVIVSLDALDPGLYQQIRGNGHDLAMAFINSVAPDLGASLHVQAVRMGENEEHLMTFHRHWKDKGINFIIQKFSDHGGMLADRKVTDLAPLHRHACWHVKRDLVVTLDGECYSCSTHSANKDFSLGNLLTDDIDKIWARGEELYASHLSQSLPDICTKCDEWYTFNF
jgi:spiro-SPASM protein